MRSRRTQRGFIVVKHPTYGSETVSEQRLIQESSAISEETMNRPYGHRLARAGTSFLWVGEDHHLDRREVWGLVRRMVRWLAVGRLKVDEEDNDGDIGS